MNVFENCLFESVELELLLSSAFTLLLLPLNKNCFSNIVGIIMLFQTFRNKTRASFIEIYCISFLLNASKRWFRLKRLFEGSPPFFTTSKRRVFRHFEHFT